MLQRMAPGAIGWLALGLVGLAGLGGVVLPFVNGDSLPGDLIDARFNSYVLEHTYQWLTGRTPRFWDAPIFYPTPLTLAFSDNHIGTAFLYWASRLAGCDRYDALRVWFVLGYAANFASAAHVLRRLGRGWIATALGAFLFAFALPVTAQAGHAQLGYRFAVPLAVLALVRFRQTTRLLALLLLELWTVWQFYCSIYLGYFLCLLLGAIVLAFALRLESAAALRLWPKTALAAWRGARGREKLAFACATALTVALLVVLLYPYLEVTRLYGFSHGWDEISQMVPQIGSYLYSTESQLWRMPPVGLRDSPWLSEHRLFIGCAPPLTILLAVALRARGRASLDPLFPVMCLALALLFLATLMIGDLSCYRLLTLVPGVSAIRAISRIILVMLFPLSLLLAGAIDAILATRWPRPARIAVLLPLAVLLVGECGAILPDRSSVAAWRERQRQAAAGLPQTLPDAPILLLAPQPGEAGELRELDAMLLTQERGWPTLNGYSGNVPVTHRETGDCRDVAADLSGALDILDMPGEEPFQALLGRVVPIGYRDCDTANPPRRVHITPFVGPLPEDIMARTALTDVTLGLRRGDPIFDVTISDTGEQPLPAGSTTLQPIEIAARYVSAGSGDLRQMPWILCGPLYDDVAAGAATRVTVALPPPPVGGPYRIVVSLLQLNVAAGWFTQHGMMPAVSKQEIRRDGQLQILADGPMGERPSQKQ